MSKKPKKSFHNRAFSYAHMTLESGDQSYKIRPSRNAGKVWLENDNGEGGDFDAGAFMDVVDKFFKENF